MSVHEKDQMVEMDDEQHDFKSSDDLKFNILSDKAL